MLITVNVRLMFLKLKLSYKIMKKAYVHLVLRRDLVNPKFMCSTDYTERYIDRYSINIL